MHHKNGEVPPNSKEVREPCASLRRNDLEMSTQIRWGSRAHFGGLESASSTQWQESVGWLGISRDSKHRRHHDSVEIRCVSSWITKFNGVGTCMQIDLHNDGRRVVESIAVKIEFCGRASVHAHKE